MGLENSGNSAQDNGTGVRDFEINEFECLRVTIIVLVSDGYGVRE
jgi:hypothetical protein